MTAPAGKRRPPDPALAGRDAIIRSPLPHPEPTCESVGRALFEFGYAEDLDEAERLAQALFPDLIREIHLEDLEASTP